MSTWTTHLGPFVLDNSGVNLQADFISWKMRQSMSLMWLRASALKAGVNILEPALVGLLSHNGGLSKTPEKDGQVSLCLFQGWAVARGGPAEDQRCPGFCAFSLFLRLGASISFGQVVSRCSRQNLESNWLLSVFHSKAQANHCGWPHGSLC